MANEKSSSSQRRLNHINAVLEKTENVASTRVIRVHSSNTEDPLELTVQVSSSHFNPALVPSSVDKSSQNDLQCIRWMLQKFQLRQDIFLLGSPGRTRRDLVMQFASILGMAVEYVSLSQDTTDSDLKLRREIRNGTAVFHEQPAVRAALYGRILVLDGVERAERNVLPVLNNLLENREMSLEDGRFLMHSAKYDQMPDIETDLNFCRVSPDFIVIALGLSVPPYVGHPLDPPFRSRFQSYALRDMGYSQILKSLAKPCHGTVPGILVKQLASIYAMMRSMTNVTDEKSSLPEFPHSLDAAVILLKTHPNVDAAWIISCVYPFAESILLSVDERAVIADAYKRCNIIYSKELNQPPSNLMIGFIPTQTHLSALQSLSRINASNQDVCILAPKGSGVSTMIAQFAHMSGFSSVSYVSLYKDMSSRDLLQRRTASENGDTTWVNSPLIDGALNGHLVVLDGIHSLVNGVLATLARLFQDRICQLPNGHNLIPISRYDDLKKRYGRTDDEMRDEWNVYPVNPTFRIISTGHIDSASRTWLNGDILTLFHFVTFGKLTTQEQITIITKKLPKSDSNLVKSIVEFADDVSTHSDPAAVSISNCLTLRQLTRICRKVSSGRKKIADVLKSVVLYQFLPTIAQEFFENKLRSHHFVETITSARDIGYPRIEQVGEDKFLVIGDIRHRVLPDSETNLSLVPDVTFQDNALQSRIMYEILQDYISGDHILLLGNQGVGKNKIVDRLLQLLNLPRCYIQLHRDTSVQNLTVSSSIVNGSLVFEDSPLVVAAQNGYILVVDEADKAPTHITAILKCLVADGYLLLPDGRRLVSGHAADNKDISIHPGFRMFVLANRPGFPFLGNDFYREIGDAFAPHVVTNPEEASEVELLKSYAPSLKTDTLVKLSRAFGILRNKVDQGELIYPYSTRELISIVKHMQMYPGDSLNDAVRNVLDFDAWNGDVRATVKKAFAEVGLDILLVADFSRTDSMGWNISPTSPLNVSEVPHEWRIGSYFQIAHIESRIPLRGSFKMTAEKTRHDIVVTNERARLFTEKLSTFRIPHHGVIRGICASSDYGSFVAVTSDPVALLSVSSDHQTCIETDLFDYLPTKTSQHIQIFRLKTPVISSKLHETVELVAIYGGEDHTLVTVDLSRNVVASYRWDKEFSQCKVSLLVSTETGFVCYSPGESNSLIMIDFMKATQHRMDFGSVVEKVLYFGESKFLVCLGTMLQVLDIFEFTVATITGSDVPLSYISPMLNGKRVALSTTSSAFLIRNDTNWQGCIQVYQFSLNNIAGWSQMASITETATVAIVGTDDDPTVCRLRLLSLENETMRVIDGIRTPLSMTREPVALMSTLSGGNLLLVTNDGQCSVYETNSDKTHTMLTAWKRMIDQPGEIFIDAHDFNDGSGVSGQFGSGGQGGEGEGEGGGEGSGSEKSNISGKMSKDARELQKVDMKTHELRKTVNPLPPDVAKKLRDAHDAALKQKLSELNMTSSDIQLYNRYSAQIQKNVMELKSILSSAEAKSRERVWIGNQVSGDFDESKLIDGITGEKAIYKRRGTQQPMVGAIQRSAKHIHFVFDLSASMARYNSHDARLERTMQVALMIMQAFSSASVIRKFMYQISGHSGHSAHVPFVQNSDTVQNPSEQMKILQQMHTHAAHCISGDNTMLALQEAIKSIKSIKDSDERFVVLTSDANISQYGINMTDISALIKENQSVVNIFVIFIGSIQDQAQELVRSLPAGHGFLCLNTADLPRIMRNILISSVVKL